jgi:hypothetical protein
MQPILILAPMAIEARTLSRAVARRSWGPVEIVTIGIGAGHLPDHSRQVRPAWIVLAGLAGGVAPNLKTGDLIVEGMPRDRMALVPFSQGRSHSAAAIVHDPAAKAKVRLETGADIVEMEKMAVDAWAARIGHSVIHIRSVLDAATDVLDPQIVGACDVFGRPKLLAFAQLLAQGPQRWRQLESLRRSSRTALASLGEAVPALLTALRAEPS